MPSKILILTDPGDVHAFAVAEALRRKGVEPVLWLTPDFPTRRGEAVLFQDGRPSLRIEGIDLDLDAVDVVWNRRPSYFLDKEKIHPADRELVHRECDTFRRSLFALLAPTAFWVNPEAAVRRNSKLLQHAAAGALGFETPDTVYTNDPEQIRSFLRRQGGQAVYKPLAPGYWNVDGHVRATYTAILREETLIDDEMLRITPGIYQELVPKRYELRVTVMGRSAFAARVLSQETESGKVDWRRSYDELRMEPCELPPEIAERSFALLDRLGLVFGAFDFIVTPDDRTVFLEVNQQGQFLFVEEYTGLPLLDAFSDFLLQGTKDFTWTAKRDGIGFLEIADLALAQSDEHLARHCPAPAQIWKEEASGD